MTITLTPETETLLRERAQQEGGDMASTADRMLRAVLHWDARDRAETLEGIRLGLEDSDAGRVRPFTEFAAEMRAKYALPTHLTDAELKAEE